MTRIYKTKDILNSPLNLEEEKVTCEGPQNKSEAGLIIQSLKKVMYFDTG